MHYAKNDITGEVIVAPTARAIEKFAKQKWGRSALFLMGEAEEYDPDKVYPCFTAWYSDGKLEGQQETWSVYNQGELRDEGLYDIAWTVDRGKTFVARADTMARCLKILTDAVIYPESVEEHTIERANRLKKAARNG